MMNPTHIIPSLSGTFGIPAKLTLNPKMPKEPSSPSLSNAEADRCNKVIINTLMNKGQLVTRYIKHLAESANFKGGTFNKHCNGLTGNRFEMPNVSYTYPLPVKMTTVQRLICLFNAKYATINFELRRIKLNFVANNALNEDFYTSKRQLARIYLE